MSQARADFTDRYGAGFFSSAARLRLPPGSHADGVRGYHLDLRAKAPPGRDVDERDLPVGSGFVAVAQAGLGHHERWVAGEGERHLERALRLGRHLLAAQRPGGGLAHTYAYRYGGDLAPGWLSAMAQGEAASLFVRLALATGEEPFAEAALRALAPLEVPVEAGGVLGSLAGRPFPEEYPTAPQSHVLNGAIFAVWGMHDVGTALDAPHWRARFDDHVETLASAVGAWDLGWWSRYDLYPWTRVVNVASSFYQVLHADQLRALCRIVPDERLNRAAERFSRQYGSRRNRARAFASKAAFRLVVPRRPIRK